MDPIDWAAWTYGKSGHYGFFGLAAFVVFVLGVVWWRGVERFNADHPPIPPTTLAAITQESNGPKLTIENARENHVSKLLMLSAVGSVTESLSYATATIKNDPARGGPSGIAKGVMVHLVFTSPIGHHLTVDGVWDPEKQWQPPPRVLDNFFGGGSDVWFDTGQRRQIVVAFKRVDSDLAYAVIEQPNVKHLEVEAPGLAIPKGEYRVVAEIRSSLSDIRQDFAFKLVNPGKGALLEIVEIKP